MKFSPFSGRNAAMLDMARTLSDRAANCQTFSVE